MAVLLPPDTTVGIVGSASGPPSPPTGGFEDLLVGQQSLEEVSLQEASTSSGAGGSSRTATGPIVIHPQKWTEEQVRSWWERRTRRRKDIGVPPKGTDGRNIMRWPVPRFEQLCNGNTGMAAALYQDLRSEIERFEQWRRGGPVPAQGGCFVSLAPPETTTTTACRPAPTTARDDGTPRLGTKPRPVPTAGEDRSPGQPRRPRPAKAGAPPPPQAKAKAQAASPTMGPAGPRYEARQRGSFDATSSRGGGSGVAGTPTRRPATGHSTGVLPPAPVLETTRKRTPTAPTGIPAVTDQTRVVAAVRPRVVTAPPAAAATDRQLDRVRGKSAPRPTRGQQQSPGGASTTASSNSASPPSASRMRLMPSASGRKSPPQQRPGRPGTQQQQQQPQQQRPQRPRTMEDMDDKALVQLSTQQRPDVERKGAPIAVAEKGAAPSRSAVDDSAVQVRRRNQSAEATASSSAEDDTTRRMFDKRELRRRHKALFDQQLSAWRAQHLREDLAPAAEGRGSGEAASSSRVKVCLRKRPLFGYEEQADEFDVISVRGRSEVFVHNCLTKADLRSLFISHMCFHFAHSFGEASTDDEVYEQCAAGAVQHAHRGGVSTIFMFGQTGSGKTHTMSGLLKRACKQLFSDAPHSPPRSGVSLTAFEIAGKNMRDLLADSSSSPAKDLKVMEDKEHRTQVLGVRNRETHSSDELLAMIENAQAHRATRATQVNDTSSRSHAVYRIWLPAADTATGSSGSSAPAVLTLVDCAGSERNADSTHHDAQSRKDAAEINSTIFALKECFRVMRSSKGQQPPYRESLLTRVLSDSFASDQAMIVALGTVSPSATDTEHSIGTLRALQQLQGTQMVSETREDVAKPRSVEVHPRTWTEDEVRRWIDEALSNRGKSQSVTITKGTDGKVLVRWPIQRFTQLCGGDEELGGVLYQDLRQCIRAAGGPST